MKEMLGSPFFSLSLIWSAWIAFDFLNLFPIFSKSNRYYICITVSH